MGGIARLPEILTTYRVHSATSSLYTKQQRLNAVRGLAFKLTRWFGDEAEDVAGRTLGLLQSRNHLQVMRNLRGWAVTSSGC